MNSKEDSRESLSQALKRLSTALMQSKIPCIVMGPVLWIALIKLQFPKFEFLGILPEPVFLLFGFFLGIFGLLAAVFLAGWLLVVFGASSQAIASYFIERKSVPKPLVYVVLLIWQLPALCVVLLLVGGNVGGW